MLSGMARISSFMRTVVFSSLGTSMPHSALARDRRLDTDIFGSQRHLDVILQVADAAHPHALIGTDLKAGDAGADMSADQRRLDAELFQDVDQLLSFESRRLYVRIRLALLPGCRIIEQRETRQPVFAVIDVKLTGERCFLILLRLTLFSIGQDAQLLFMLLLRCHDVQMIFFLLGEQRRLLHLLHRRIIRIHEKGRRVHRAVIDTDIGDAPWLFFVLARRLRRLAARLQADPRESLAERRRADMACMHAQRDTHQDHGAATILVPV